MFFNFFLNFVSKALRRKNFHVCNEREFQLVQLFVGLNLDGYDSYLHYLVTFSSIFCMMCADLLHS